MKRALLLFAAAAVIAGPAAGQTMMSQADVEAAFKGASFDIKAPDGYAGTLTFNPDMTLSISGNDGTGDRGTYRFAEGGYCSTWENFRNGVEACFTAESISGTEYQLYTLDGQKDDYFTKR